MRIFNRLFVKVYFTIVASLLLVVVVSALAFRAGPEADSARSAFRMAGGVLIASLADGAAPAETQRAAVNRLSQLINADIALYGTDGKLIAAAGYATAPRLKSHGPI